MWFILYDILDIYTIAYLLIGLSLFYSWYRRPCSNFPPGPRGFPLLGCIPFLGMRPEIEFLDYAKTYGNIFSVRIGMKEWVVLNDASAIHEGFVKHGAQSSNRPPTPFLDKCSDYIGFVTLNYNQYWRSQKHFGVTTLRGFGVGKKSMEDRITEEIVYLSDVIKSNNEAPFDMKNCISMAICNNIASVVFGSRFEYKDPMFIEIIRIIRLSLTHPDTVRTFKIITLSPMLEHVPPFRGHLQKLLKEIKKELGMFKQIVDEHKKTFDKNNLRDFTDAFILKMNENTDSSFTDAQLLQFIRELFMAGTETATNTLLWGILCLLHNPEAEKKLYKEILYIVGSEGKVTYAHKDMMPYASAFIEELYRYRTMAPISAPHSTSCDVIIGGYNLPKGTAILPNVWGAHNSPNDWKYPEKFIPERHLNSNGEFVKSKNVLPYGVGPRACLGEQLARMEVFIYFVSLVQKFHFEPDPTMSTLPEINKSHQGLSNVPYSFDVVVRER